MILALVACLLIPHLVQSTPWGPPQSYADSRMSPYGSNPYGAAPSTYNQNKYDVPKYQPEPPKSSYGVPSYEPTKSSYGVPNYEPTKSSYGVPSYEPTKSSYGVSYKPEPIYTPQPQIYTTPAPTEYYVQTERYNPYYGKTKIEPEFAAVIIGDCDKVRGIEASEVYSPNVKSSIVPASPLDTCTLPAGVFYNGSLIVCGGGCQATGTPCYTNKIGCDTWEPMTPLKEFRERFTMTVVDSCNALVVVGGFKCTNDIEIFYNGKWMAGPNHNGLHGLVYHSSVSFSQSQVMVIGGLLKGRPTKNVYTIDVSNGRVEKAASLNFKRYSHASSRVSFGGNDYIIVAGGFDGYCVSNTVESIKASDDGYTKPTWKLLAPMNIKRFDFGLAMYVNQLAAFGGLPHMESEHIEVYDQVTNRWKIVGQRIAHSERPFFTAITVPDSYFQETPGENPPCSTDEPSHFSTPSYHNQPSYAGSPPFANAPANTGSHTPKDHAYATVLVGGCDDDIGIKESVLYSQNLESNIIPASPMLTCTKAAGVFYNGLLVICGGGEGQRTPCYSNEIGSHEWEEFCPLLEHRDKFTMTAVERINALVVVGGFKSGKDVEIYKDGKWQYGPQLGKDQGLVHHCSVQYNNKVMVTGGFCNGKPTDTVKTIDVI